MASRDGALAAKTFLARHGRSDDVRLAALCDAPNAGALPSGQSNATMGDVLWPSVPGENPLSDAKAWLALSVNSSAPSTERLRAPATKQRVAYELKELV